VCLKNVIEEILHVLNQNERKTIYGGTEQHATCSMW